MEIFKDLLYIDVMELYNIVNNRLSCVITDVITDYDYI